MQTPSLAFRHLLPRMKDAVDVADGFCIAFILRSRADSLRSHVILHEWLAFHCAFFEYPPKWWVLVHYYYYYWSLLYSAILRSRQSSLRSHVILHEWIAFYSACLNIHRSGVLTALAWLVPQETAAVSARSVYTSPWYNLTGWLGVKHQLTYLLCTPHNHRPTTT